MRARLAPGKGTRGESELATDVRESLLEAPARLQCMQAELAGVASELRVLRHLAWPREVRERFLAAGGRELPRVSFPAFDPDPARRRLRAIREALDSERGSVAAWLRGQVTSIERSVSLLASTGTAAFTGHSRALFGAPDTPPLTGEPTPLAVTLELERLADATAGTAGDRTAEHDAESAAARLRDAIRARFGQEGPPVTVVDELSADVLAGPERVGVRRNATFSEGALAQLLAHEVDVHVLTTRNGAAQDRLPLLGRPHPATTRTQEGLAVFGELVTGRLDGERLRRLTGRVRAIAMALDGADFIEVHRFFRERGLAPEPAFEQARRVFRGAPLRGGGAFTKDGTYLDGLVRVHHHVRAARAAGREDGVRLLFAGKLDLADLPALARLAGHGLCRPPRHLPPWITAPLPDADTGLAGAVARAIERPGLEAACRVAVEAIARQ
jgi:uncharacterized protein (TIGR02421 family)